MKKRAVIFFGCMMLGMLFCLLSIFTTADGKGYAQTAQQQSSYRITVDKTRGTIYDCNLVPLTGTTKQFLAAVVPTVEGSAALSKVLSAEAMAAAYTQMTAGKPFLLKLPGNMTAPGLTVFETDRRYAENQLAVHVLGYVNGSGEGASGIEKAFQTTLSENQGSISVVYRVDAFNRVLAGEEKKISDTSYLKNSGVVLTLDSKIQRIAEEAAKKYLEKGTVIVTEIPSCKVRAMVSTPSYNPNDVASSFSSQDSPLLNRALQPYSVGSVFKLVAASAALQYGISPDTKYVCEGAVDVEGLSFHCFGGEAHGEETMKEAIANSCNTYFINLMQQLPPAQYLLMAQSFGFGKTMDLAPGYSSASGVLPSLKSLALPRALANFSFGQGELTATPLQVAAMVNTIICNGRFTQPSIYEGTVDSHLNYTQKPQVNEPTTVISEGTAKMIQSFMELSVENGTSSKGKPLKGGAGAKTSTAETGQTENGKDGVVSWYAGYYPKDDPKYVITIMAEGGAGGGTTCGPVFRKITDELNKEGFVQLPE